MTAPNTTIAILDVATSGYREKHDQILEVACILVDAATFEVLETAHGVVHHDAGSVEAPDFHTALLRECALESASSLKATEGFLMAGPWTTADLLCNRALDFDLRFLAVHMPTLHKALIKNKPQIELKALERVHAARGGQPYVSAMPRTFRASDDAIAAYEELVHYYSGGVL